eukprot:6966916-Heterocapsa_arctica.AAC.1
MRPNHAPPACSPPAEGATPGALAHLMVLPRGEVALGFPPAPLDTGTLQGRPGPDTGNARPGLPDARNARPGSSHVEQAAAMRPRRAPL